MAQALIEHPDIRGVTFVGTSQVGRDIYGKCGQMGKRAIVQGAAKNFMVVMSDTNVEATVRALMNSLFGVLHGQGRDAVRFFTESKVVIQRWF